MKEINQNTVSYFEIILILFGWILGIISSLIIEKYKNYASRKEIMKGIKSELNELKLRLAATNLELTFRIGDISLEYAKWIKPYYKLLFEGETYSYLRTVPKITNPITNLSNEEFQNCLIISSQRSTNDNLITTPSVPKIELPYLENKYSSISLFKEKSVFKFAQLRKEIISINDCIDDVKYYHNKSFENLSETNRRIVEHNINTNISSIRNKTKHIIKLIEEILK
jgi:hypothetical protein